MLAAKQKLADANEIPGPEDHKGRADDKSEAVASAEEALRKAIKDSLLQKLISAVQTALDDKRLKLIIRQVREVIKQSQPLTVPLTDSREVKVKTQIHAVTTCRGVTSNDKGFTSEYLDDPSKVAHRPTTPPPHHPTAPPPHHPITR